jgi:hypothetical protein
MTTMNVALTCSFGKIKNRNAKHKTSLYPTVICATFRA